MKASTIFASLIAITSVTARPEPAKVKPPSRGGGKNGVTGKGGYVPPVTRDDLDKAMAKPEDFRVDCDPENLRGKGFEAAWTKPLEEGANYLGKISNDRHPNRPAWSCERVSCSYHAAIYWCNESGNHRELQSYSSIAVGARAIIDQCVTTNAVSMPIVKGAAYHGTGWKVEVRVDYNKC